MTIPRAQIRARGICLFCGVRDTAAQSAQASRVCGVDYLQLLIAESRRFQSAEIALELGGGACAYDHTRYFPVT